MKKLFLFGIFCLITLACVSTAEPTEIPVETLVSLELTKISSVNKPDNNVQPISTFPPPADPIANPKLPEIVEPTTMTIPTLSNIVQDVQLPTISRSGSGDSVVDIPEMTIGYKFVSFSNNGSANFIVYSYDSSGNKDNLLVNAIGSYSGRQVLPKGEPITRFEIKSDGQWALEIKSNSPDAINRINAPASYHGEGDDVIGITGQPDTADFVYSGDRNFIVYGYAKNGENALLVNAIGPYQGKVIIPSQVVLLEIKATGGWDLNVSAK